MSVGQSEALHVEMTILITATFFLIFLITVEIMAQTKEDMARELCFVCKQKPKHICSCRGRYLFEQDFPPCVNAFRSGQVVTNGYPIEVSFPTRPLIDGSGLCVMHICSPACHEAFLYMISHPDGDPRKNK